MHFPCCNIISNLSNNNNSIYCVFCYVPDVVSGALHTVFHVIFPICKVVVVCSILEIEKLRLRELKQLVKNYQLMETRLIPLISVFIFLLLYHATFHHFK